jgi:hypothetical protein
MSIAMFHASSAPHTMAAGRRERGAQRHAFSAFGAEMLRGDRKKGHEMQRGHGPQHDEMMRAADLPRGHDGNCKKRRRGGEECKKAPRRRPSAATTRGAGPAAANCASRRTLNALVTGISAPNTHWMTDMPLKVAA